MNILLIDAFPADMIAALKGISGATVRHEPDWMREKILANVGDVEVLIMNSKIRGDAALLEAAPKLKMVCRAGVGLDHIDVPLLESRGVKVVITPGANADSVAEHAIGMLLSLMHWIPRANAQVKQREWRREMNRGTELRGKTVGIIGYGHTGSAVGNKLRGMGCRVLAYDKYKSNFAPEWVTECGLEQIKAEADIITLHVPLTEVTQGCVNEKFLNECAKNIWLLNLARGPIVPLEGLVAALKSGKVRGAALDVLENEDFTRLSVPEEMRLESLFEMDNVIFTPHIGGWSFESLQRINGMIVDAVRGLIERG
jgi:D-3-phosphoglycerate dehydrogenase / 2-oxoglutarate reductase